MPNHCLVHGSSHRSDMNAGVSAHFSPTLKRERDKWFRFVHTHHTNLNPRKVWWMWSVYFAEECFARAFHIEGLFLAQFLQ